MAFGVVIKDPSQRNSVGAVRVQAMNGQSKRTASFVDITPAANPTDIMAVMIGPLDGITRVNKITLSATADTATSLNVLVQRSGNGGGGSSASVIDAFFDPMGIGITISNLYLYSANRTSGGDGISAGRPVISMAKLQVGTVAAPAPALVFDFGEDGIVLRDNIGWVVVNMQGQALPSGFKLSGAVTRTDERAMHVTLAGDSTTDYRASGGTLWQTYLAAEGALTAYDFCNHATNGSTLLDYINGAGVYYALSASISITPSTFQRGKTHKFVICYGINDVRTGACDQATLIARLNTCINTIKASRPDAEIILHGPNMLCTDGASVTATGIFSGMTGAQAAQNATDILYNAYASFVGDARVKAVVQKQDITGRTSISVAATGGSMLDQLHPAARWQMLFAHQVLPYL